MLSRENTGRMNSLIIPATYNTPAVSFDPAGELTIMGRSITTRALAFYGPLLEWLGDYSVNPAPLTILNLDFEILHVDSLARVMNICQLLAQLNRAGYNAAINWYCQKNDEDMRDMAGMVSELLKSIQINEILVETDAA